MKSKNILSIPVNTNDALIKNSNLSEHETKIFNQQIIETVEKEAQDKNNIMMYAIYAYSLSGKVKVPIKSFSYFISDNRKHNSFDYQAIEKIVFSSLSLFQKKTPNNLLIPVPTLHVSSECEHKGVSISYMMFVPISYSDERIEQIYKELEELFNKTLSNLPS